MRETVYFQAANRSKLFTADAMRLVYLTADDGQSEYVFIFVSNNQCKYDLPTCKL